MIDLSKLSKTAREKKGQEFLGDYIELCKKHQLQFLPGITLNERGIMPKLDIVEYKEDDKPRS